MNSRPWCRPYDVRCRDVPSLVFTRDGVEVATWPLPGLAADLVVLDALARLQLAARRLGWAMAVRNPGAELAGLLELTGLVAVAGGEPASVEMQGHPEDLEQVGVEEVVVPDDSTV